MIRLARTVLTGGLVMLAVAAPSAHAEFAAPELVTASTRIQLGGSQVALSADGSTAAFVTLSDVLLTAPPAGQRWSGGGLFVRSVATGELTLVVPATIARADEPGAVPGQLAGAASVSANGRWVGFATSAQLVPQDDNTVNDVYVRDLTRGITDPSAFRLVSARGLADAPLHYEPSESSPVAGSAIGRAGISNDGQRVAFTVDATSDVDGAATPSGQVAIRDLRTGTVELVSRSRAAGAAPVGQQPADVAISGDGTTVMWLARRASSQVALGPEDASGATPLQDQVPQLLWRRLPAGPTRLVVGVSDPDDPGCGAGEVVGIAPDPGACDGPIRVPLGLDPTDRIVTSASLSRDGRTVAVAALGNRLDVDGRAGADVYEVAMADGLSRKQATRRVTRGADATGAVGALEVALAPDSSYLAFTATRWSPATAPPAPIGQFPASPADTAVVYGVDTQRNTIELISRGYDGSGVLANTAAPVVADAGRVVGYLSTANNLVYGDANGTIEGSGGDAFLQRRIIRDAEPGPVIVPPASLSEVVTPAWKLGVTSRAHRDGTIHVAIRTPAAGRITVRSTPTSPAGTRRRIASVTRRAARGGLTNLVLRPRGRDARAARRDRGLASTIAVTFAPETGTPLRTEIRARYRKRATR